MKVAVLMDPLKCLNPKKDTTLALIHAAIKLGHEVRCFISSDLYMSHGEVMARTISLSAPATSQEHWQQVGQKQEELLKNYQIVLMRQNPPVNSQYLYASYLLELLEKDGVIVSNRPQSVRDVNEKLGILHFPELMPMTLVSMDRTLLYEFWQHHNDVVFKPLYGMGGESVFHVDAKAANLHVILDTLTQHGKRTIMAQKFIPAIIDKGDKRVLMVHGEPIPYGLARIPAKDDFRGNLAAGATGEMVALTSRDQQICQKVSPFLKEKGLHFVGLDIIGEYLTEINVTSPTCLREISVASGMDIALIYWNGL